MITAYDILVINYSTIRPTVKLAFVPVLSREWADPHISLVKSLLFGQTKSFRLVQLKLLNFILYQF